MHLSDSASQENIPPQYRTIPGVHRLTAARLGGGLARVAHITFPISPSDRPRGPPKCRGYALVTLLDLNDAAKLVEAYPWRSRPSTIESEGTDARSEAARFGLRALSQARWDELQAEYQERKARVMQEIAAYEDAQMAGIVHKMDSRERASPAPREATPSEPTITTPTSSGPTLDASAPYSYGCLVFVRGVHIETNKTTLKTLFGRAVDGEGIDYVDYAKGMDSVRSALHT